VNGEKASLTIMGAPVTRETGHTHNNTTRTTLQTCEYEEVLECEWRSDVGRAIRGGTCEYEEVLGCEWREQRGRRGWGDTCEYGEVLGSSP